MAGALDLLQDPRAVRKVSVRLAATVRSQRSSGELPERHVLLGPDPRDRGADVEPAEGPTRFVEEPSCVLLAGEIGLRRDRASAAVGGDGLGPLLGAVVMDHDRAARGRERPRARRSDPA